MHTGVYVCMHVCVYVCMFVCKYLCLNVCMYVCLHECMYVCMYVVCMYVCVCVHAQGYFDTHVFRHTSVNCLNMDSDTDIVLPTWGGYD